MQGAPLRGIFHTDESGKSFITCQKHKYTHPQPKREPLTDEQQIAEALRRHGLVLVKTANGYDVLKLGQITAHGIGGAA